MVDMEYDYDYTLPDGRHVGVVISRGGYPKRPVYRVVVDGHQRNRIYSLPENPEKDLEWVIRRMFGFDKE